MSLDEGRYRGIRAFCYDNIFVASQSHNEVVENFIKYLERLITEVKKAETVFERFEDTTLNEGNLTELPPCKS